MYQWSKAFLGMAQSVHWKVPEIQPKHISCREISLDNWDSSDFAKTLHGKSIKLCKRPIPFHRLSPKYNLILQMLLQLLVNQSKKETNQALPCTFCKLGSNETAKLPLSPQILGHWTNLYSNTCQQEFLLPALYADLFKNPNAHSLSLKIPWGCHHLSCSWISWEG